MASTTMASSTANATIPEHSVDEPDPCEPFPRVVPDFSARGRRLSQVKCYEYIWGIKYREEKDEREQKCEEKKHGKIKYYVVGYSRRDAAEGEFPHMAAIGWKGVDGNWIFKCGGSLVSEKFVLTAAHCTRVPSLDDSVAEPEPKIVKLGTIHYLTKKASQIQRESHGGRTIQANILRTIIHPDYHSPNRYNDIALFELERPIEEFTYNIQPACLWGQTNNTIFGSTAIITGWGVTDSVKQTLSSDLQAADVDFIDLKLCRQLYQHRCSRNWCGLRNQICAGKLEEGVADTCQGDSGGPLQVRIKLPESVESKIHYIVGVTSFGAGSGCAKKNSPGIYTRVASYIDWIENIVWPK